MLTRESLNRKNFKWQEFFVSDTAYRINHDANPKNDFENYPPKEHELSILPCLMNTADMAQELYDILKQGVIDICGPAFVTNFKLGIESAYRCKILNDLVGGQPDSQHMQGLAIDFTCGFFGKPETILKFLFQKKFLVDQCLMEGTWLHISRKLVKSQNRMEYAYYLPNPKTGKREKKLLAK